MERVCLNGCSELIRTSPTRRLFCSQTCRQKFLKTFEGECYYCGEPEAHQDHLYPQSIGHGVGEKLPACEDCNIYLSDKYPNSHMRRLRALIGYLNGDNENGLVSEKWSPDETDEMDRGYLRDIIEQSIRRERLSSSRALHACERLMEVLDLQYPSAEEEGTELDDYSYEDGSSADDYSEEF